MHDSVLEARDCDKTALVGDVAGSRAETSGNQGGGGEESVLLESAVVGVTTPAEQVAPASVVPRLQCHMG